MTLPQEIIRKKRDGYILSDSEIKEFFEGGLSGQVADYQTSAMLMAIVLKGMNHQETASLTKIMRDSGKILSWDFPKHLIVDKHSTGGIGDKVSLILLPLCVLEGVKMPMMAGRGLGHTGGTLDKLESVPGLTAYLPLVKVQKIVTELGGVFMGQTDEIVRLDKKLYSMRDVTATVESIPLITGSILSKKLAEGLGGLVMDVKFGSGAFMQKYEDARQLADSLTKVGKECGLNIRSYLTSMDSPLGTHAGNALELYETVELLQGKGPSSTKELTLTLAAEVISLAFPKRSSPEIRKKLQSHLQSGAAFERFCKIIVAQGGDASFLEQPNRLLTARIKEPIILNKTGYVQKINVRSLGIAVQSLGGGRRQISDKIDYAVGLSDLKRIGDLIEEKEPVAFVHGNDETKVKEAGEIIYSAYQIGDEKIEDKLIRERLE